jgi:type I restriction enzyme R subunit
LSTALPLGVIELKNAADENATIWDAFNQLQTYKQQIPTLFIYNQALVISDGLDARIGTLTADRERFMPWRTIEGETIAPASLTRLEVLLRGVFEPHRFLDLLHHFIVFEDDSAVKVLGDETLKTIARELVETVRRNATIDWTVRETARAKLRVMVRRSLRKYGYPPDKQEKATQTVLEQAELIAKDWAG